MRTPTAQFPSVETCQWFSLPCALEAVSPLNCGLWGPKERKKIQGPKVGENGKTKHNVCRSSAHLQNFQKFLATQLEDMANPDPRDHLGGLGPPLGPMFCHFGAHSDHFFGPQAVGVLKKDQNGREFALNWELGGQHSIAGGGWFCAPFFGEESSTIQPSLGLDAPYSS